MRSHVRRGLLAALVMATGVMTVWASGRVHAISVNPASTRLNLQPTFNAMTTVLEDGNACLNAGINLDGDLQALLHHQGNAQKSLNDASTTATTCFNNYKAVARLSFPASLAYFHIVHLTQSMEKRLVANLYYMGADTSHALKKDHKATLVDAYYDDYDATTVFGLQDELLTGFREDLHAAHPNIIVPHIIVPHLQRTHHPINHWMTLLPPPCSRTACLDWSTTRPHNA